MKSAVLLLMLLTGMCALNAQQPGVELTEGETLFSNKCYGTALRYYLHNIKTTSGNGIVYYKAGICYLNSRSQKSNAAEYLAKAAEMSPSFYTHGYAKETEAPADVFKYLGDAYHLNYQFDKAIKSFEKYKELLNAAKVKDLAEIKKTEEKIEISKFAHEFNQSVGLPESFKMAIVKNGGSDIGEFSSAMSDDKLMMVYTLKVPVDKLKKFDDDKYFETGNVPASNKTDSSPSKLSKPKNSSGKQSDTIVNITTVGASYDGQVVLTFRDDAGEGNLYVTRLKDNEWTDPARLPKTANLKGWEQNEFVTADGTYLYFVSDRAGGYGGKDIYRCKRLPNGEWSKAVNLGSEINSQYDDQAPFMHPDGTTLYFSSNRFKPSVSYDIFTSKLSSDKWSKPLLVGYPVNSSEKDAYYQVSAGKKKVITADANPTGQGVKGEKKDKVPSEKGSAGKKKPSAKDLLKEEAKKLSDNYKVTFENPEKSALTMLNGVVTEFNKDIPIHAEITIEDVESEKEIGKFYSNSSSGLYSFVIPPGKSTSVTYQADGYLFQSENHLITPAKNYYDKHTPVKLHLLEEGVKTNLNNVFFDEEKAILKSGSLIELNRVYDLLVSHPGMKIKICNYIYSPIKAYKTLSQERANAVVAYLVEKGINKKRLEAVGERKSKLPEGSKIEKGNEELQKPVQQIELEIKELKK